MTLRRPAAQLRRAPVGWRRSGDESYWDSLVSEGDAAPSVSRPQRAARPQSAIEGRQLDGWLEHLQRMQSNLLRTPAHNQAPSFNDRTTSMSALDRESPGRSWRQTGTPSSSSFSRASSSCGSSSMCGSLLGSQESLQTGFLSPPERRGSCERVHITETPKKEHAQLSHLAPVKIGWLPIQRKVMVADASHQNQLPDHSAGQVKLKQPITPIFHKIRGAVNRHQDGEVERSHTSPSALSVRTWQPPGQDSTINKQVPEKQNFPAREGERPVGWQALRRGWNTNRVSVFPRGVQSAETNSDPNRRSPMMKTTTAEPPKHTPLHRAASTDPYKPNSQLQGTNSAETYKSHTPLHRTGNAQPLRATAPLCGTNSGSHSPQTQTSSAVTTLVPQSKTSFSSITISSRKVSRSASLPLSDSGVSSSRSSQSPPPPNQQMDTNSRQVTVQRKATIVKVTEQRVVSSPASSTKREEDALDTVVHRRKATIIKVTEHRESYGPAKAGPGTRNPNYRHSFTEGLHKDWSQGNYLQHNAAPSHPHLDSTKRPNSAPTPQKSTPEPEKNMHRSTLSLILSSPLAIAAPGPPEVSLRAPGRRSDRPPRPQSCYGNVSGHTEPSEANVTQPAARKWSFGLPRETDVHPVNPGSRFIGPPTVGREAGQPVAGDLLPNGGGRGELPLERRASPCLTLIKAPDPHSHQSPEEVLALNAAAVIANIKLQRQLSKKKAPNGNTEKDSVSPGGNTVTDEGKRTDPQPDQSPARRHNPPPHAAFVPLSHQPERSPETVSLQDALKKSRPDFISRSQGRLRELERRAQERRTQAAPADPQSDASLRHRRSHNAQSTSAKDNLFKPRDGAVIGREAQLRSKRAPAEARRKKEVQEKKKEVCLTNKQRVELFKKKLLDQILQRGGS